MRFPLLFELLAGSVFAGLLSLEFPGKAARALSLCAAIVAGVVLLAALLFSF